MFRDGGGTNSIYNDDIDLTIEIDGRRLRLTDNVVIVPDEYTLGVTGEYAALLKHARLLDEILHTDDFYL